MLGVWGEIPACTARAAMKRVKMSWSCILRVEVGLRVQDGWNAGFNECMKSLSERWDEEGNDSRTTKMILAGWISKGSMRDTLFNSLPLLGLSRCHLLHDDHA